MLAHAVGKGIRDPVVRKNVPSAEYNFPKSSHAKPQADCTRKAIVPSCCGRVLMVEFGNFCRMKSGIKSLCGSFLLRMFNSSVISQAACGFSICFFQQH
jgi:hypothetical protein